MASITFDASTGWWSIRYYAGRDRPRLKKGLCKHPTAWSKSRPPSSKRIPLEVKRLAQPYEELERQARSGFTPVSKSIDLASYVRAYIAEYERGHRENSVSCLKGVTEKFLAFCAARKVKHLGDVSPAVCADWIADRLAEAKASTVRTERHYLTPIWSRARRRREVTENPWDAAPVNVPIEEPPPKFWTVEELVRLIGEFTDWMRDWIILDCNTGLRVSALLGLRWGDVSFEHNTITLPAELSKGKSAYVVPLNPPANEVLARRWVEAKNTGPQSLIFPSPRESKPFHSRTVFTRIKRAVKRAGVRDFGHYCHALRHSFAVALVDQNVSLRVIQSFLGHKNIRTTERYGNLRPGKAQEVMQGFEIRPPAADGTSSPEAKPCDPGNAERPRSDSSDDCRSDDPARGASPA